jgi:hypothetical protein
MKKFLLALALVVVFATPAFAATDGFVVEKPLEPFLLYEEMYGSYQATGWMKSTSLASCHMSEGEGNALQEYCLTSREVVNVRQKPNGHRVIGSLFKGVPVLVAKRQGDWAEIETNCSGNLVPIAPISTQSNGGVRVYSCEVKQEEEK